MTHINEPIIQVKKEVREMLQTVGPLTVREIREAYG